MLIKLLILINLKLLATYGQQSAPLCGYHVQNGVYTCNLLINNPDIRADFQRIEGVHLTGFNDSSVQLLRASQQTTYNIPSVICRQFSNLKELIVILSQVQVISQSSFAGCFELEILKLYYNSIPSLHPFMFINNPHLHTVDLAYNRIGSLPPDVFRGTLLKTLFLDDNQFQSFLGSRLSDVAETLTSLNLRNNFMTNFPPQTFAPLRNLELLDLDSNQIITFPLDAFNELSNLQDLILYNNQIRWLRPEWFRPLESLQRLRLENNGIEELPQGIFASNNQLQKLWMSNNNIKVIDSNAFGNLQNLEGIYFEFNLIDAIDEKFFNRAVNLYNLYLYSNICTTSLFTNVNNTRQQVRNALRRCFDNFIPANNGSILCNYEANDIGYTCWMDIDNPLGIDFESIPGEHVENFNNENVTSVQSFLQRTQNIPSVICRQFMNLQFIYIAMCRVEELTQEAFEHCANLEYLNLDFDDIRAVPGNTFSSSPKLNTLSLYVNKITEVAPNAFAGTTLEFLNLGVNQISSINPSWFEDGRGAAMKYLRIDSNVIRILPGNGFSNLRHLSELVVSNNPLEEISDNAFFGLDYLEILNLSECHITALQPQWFIDMENLQRLYLIGNQLTELPVGIFHNLTHLSVANNRLQAINANSFRNVNNLIVLNAQNNQINEVDPDLYDNAAGLYTLQLLNNECASINIVNLPLNREFYRDRFELCFENFMLENFGFIECEYTHVEVIGYHCIMSIYNVRGNNNYEEIEGEHLENFGNSDVVFVEAYQQQTTIIPSVICRQFENLKLLYFGFNGVDEIFAGNFDNCRNLEYLNIEANNLRIIPELFIQNSGNLHTLTLDKNQLSAIAENAFVGTAISSLRLEDNLLTDFNVNWFNGINETLQILSFRNNSFTFLPENSFENLQILQELEIGFNDLSDLSDNIFQGLSNLLFLSLSSCNIRDLKPSWFTDLTSLGSLFLNYNHLTSIPDGIFTNQLTLYEINFNGNRLSSLNSEAFGNLSSILYISAINNRINLIDPKLYDDAENLYNLFLFNNLCVDDSFLSIINNRDVVREQLQTCFENFENDGFMECSYVNNAAYTCELSVQNVLGRANPDRIGGEHDDNMGDADVIFVEALLQHTASFPAVICRQFSSLTYVYILESKLEFLTREAFENCVNLEALILEQNEIRIIPENVFSSLPELSLLSFFSNEINQIHPNAFTGTSLTYINLNENQLTSVNPEWFEGTRGDSLMYYMIGANNIGTLQSNAFPNLPKIVEISLSLNLLTEIADDAFAGLTNLQILELNNCGLETLSHQWFNDLPGLLRIYLNQNDLRELPEGIFGNLTHIYVANNQLQRIDANSFTNLGRLVLFNGRNNQINEIDPVFFNDTQSMYNLQLAGNICVSIDVMNMALNREYYRQLFDQCFDNFDGGN